MSDRVNRLRLIGARTLNRDEWARAVTEAVTAVEARDVAMRGRFDASADPILVKHSTRPVWLRPWQLVVDAQLVLGAEMALVEAEELLRRIENLAGDDLDSARRFRLQRTIEQCRDAIAKRLATEPS